MRIEWKISYVISHIVLNDSRTEDSEGVRLI